ncbi:MAG: type IVB secretion system protein IcmH/DotU [Planctomycetota bacterium]|nr:type IVB secretion system protein IcmH/DotU [Planctomycetota bacterium]
MVQATQVTQDTRLAELAADVLAFAVQLRGAPEPDAEGLRADVRRLLSAFDASAQVAGKEPAVIDAARYAMVAFLDEIVLTSSWDLRQAWSGRPLQMEYFNDFTAGQEFYNKLEALRGGDGQRGEALEIYGLALGLGFRGMYAGVAGAEQAHQLRARIYGELAPAVGQQPLSPNGKVEMQISHLTKRVPAWVFAAISMGALMLVCTVLLLWLLFDSNGVEERLNQKAGKAEKQWSDFRQSRDAAGANGSENK